MQININHNVNFKAKDPRIRFADNLARRANQEFPRISATKMECLNHADDYPQVINRLKADIRKLRFEQNMQMRPSTMASEFADILLQSIKRAKKGNCGESAEIALIIAKLNGIDDCTKACLQNPYGGNFDHSVVYVKAKKPYIIDAWLGFADYVPNAIKRYQSEFRRYFDFDKYGEKMVIKEPFYNYDEIFSQREIEKIK